MYDSRKLLDTLYTGDAEGERGSAVEVVLLFCCFAVLLFCCFATYYTLHTYHYHDTKCCFLAGYLATSFGLILIVVYYFYYYITIH
jgi:hypothetical protein